MNTGMWYLRCYKGGAIKREGYEFKARYNEFVLPAFDLVKVIRHQVRIDAVCLDDGRVARHDYKKPLPEWLKHPMIRQMAATTGKIP